MKKLIAFCFAAVLWIAASSFSGTWGGDSFAIYLNGKQVLQQFVYADKSVKTLSLASASENDKIEVLYSHCGRGGKARILTIRNAKNEVVKKLSFGDDTEKPSQMGFYRKDVPGPKGANLSLSYASTELPKGMLLARIVWQEAKAVVKL